MSEENGEKRQGETQMEEALRGENLQRLRQLQGRMERVTLHVTAEEYRSLVDKCKIGSSVEALLEAFVSDLTDSARRVWSQCHLEAHNWYAAHEEGESVLDALCEADEAAGKGGDKC